MLQFYLKASYQLVNAKSRDRTCMVMSVLGMLSIRMADAQRDTLFGDDR